MSLILSLMFFSSPKWENKGRTGSAWKRGGAGRVAQTMYTHVSKCKNNTIWVLYFWQYWMLSLGLALVRQVLHHLSYTTSSFCFSYFSNRVLLLASVRLGPKSSYLYTSHIARITSMHRCAQLIG
jgi:hypothetical protein